MPYALPGPHLILCCSHPLFILGAPLYQFRDPGDSHINMRYPVPGGKVHHPGLGQAAVTAGLGSDLPLLLGITVVTAAIVFLGSLSADLLYGAVDPRIRRGVARHS